MTANVIAAFEPRGGLAVGVASEAGGGVTFALLNCLHALGATTLERGEERTLRYRVAWSEDGLPALVASLKAGVGPLPLPPAASMPSLLR